MTKATVIIVGAGVIGLSTAYNLAKLGIKDIIVIEREYLNYGASTRSASQFRVHFWAEENARFAIESKKRLLNLASETRWTQFIGCGGYLWLHNDENRVKNFRRANEMWTRLGVPVVFLSPEEVRERYPYINTEGLIAASYGPQNGQLNPDCLSYGYYTASKKMGVQYLDHTEVKKIIAKGNIIIGVETNRGLVEGEKIVIAAGAWSEELLRTVSVNLPMKPERREAVITEPFKYFIRPFIILPPGLDAYLGQLLHGEIISSSGKSVEMGLVPLTNTIKHAKDLSKAIVKVVPALKYARIKRMFSGYVIRTSDMSQILGRDPEWLEGLYVATSFSGHGVMMATLAGEVMARYVAFGEIPEVMRPYLPTRFREGKLLNEKMVTLKGLEERVV